MERIPLDHLSRDELVRLIERLLDRLDGLERQNAELTERLEKQARRIKELEQRHQTVRLDESYSMKAEVQRRADGKKKGNLPILAFCLMPNPWHFVVRPSTDEELSSFFHWLTHTHVMRWHAHYHTEGTGHLYQGLCAYACRN